VFEWLQGDPVNGMLMTLTFFTFLIAGRQLRLWQIRRKALAESKSKEEQGGLILETQVDKSASPLFRLDARVKFICAVVAAFSAISLTNAWYEFIYIFACVFLAAVSRASLKGYFKRLLYPLSLALLIAAIQMFSGGHVVEIVPILGWKVTAEGILSGTLVFTRVLAAVSILNLLISVTPMETLLDSLSWFHVPTVLLDTTMLMYRYIHVVNEERTRIFTAQQSRCGFIKSVSPLRKLGNYGIVGGMLLVKSFDRAMKVGNAMVSRGYSGTSSLFSYSSKPFTNRHKAICIIVIAAVIALVLLNYNII
jgi:cobalt/nickel transport system permease protein